jgi:simple sugar transport system permease protein
MASAQNSAANHRKHKVMANDAVLNTLASIIRSGAPLILAATGETFTERAGVVNLALDGSLMLSALAGFAVAFNTQSVFLGAIAGILVGATIALIVAICNIELKQSQVAIGFVLTLLCRDLAIFLGTAYRGKQGLPAPYFEIPILRDIPILGPLFFQQDAFTYLSFIAIFAAWFWIFRTRPGLVLRSVGERPATTFARGGSVNRLRYLYTAFGGAMVGLAGAAYSLNVAPGWLETAVSGNGWIALAIVIFGGWYPQRIAFGVYLVAGLRTLAAGLQASGIPIALLNAIPWLLMIGTLLVVSMPYLEPLIRRLPASVQPTVRTLLRAKPPAALGALFEQEGR